MRFPPNSQRKTDAVTHLQDHKKHDRECEFIEESTPEEACRYVALVCRGTMAAQLVRRLAAIYGNRIHLSRAKLLILLPLIPSEYREYHQEAIRNEKVGCSIHLSGTKCKGP